MWKEIEGEDCIEFFDGPEEVEFREQGPSLHHFRSSNIRAEQQYIQRCWEECIETSIKIPATKLRDSTGKWKTSDVCLSSQTEKEEVHDEEDHMEQDMQLEDSIKNDNGPEDEVEDEAVLVDDNEKNLEKDMISVQVESDISERQHSETDEDETDEPTANKAKISEDFSLSSKTAKALAEILGITKDVLLYEKLKNNATKKFKFEIPQRALLKPPAIIQVQVLKQYKEINKAKSQQ